MEMVESNFGADYSGTVVRSETHSDTALLTDLRMLVWKTSFRIATCACIIQPSPMHELGF